MSILSKNLQYLMEKTKLNKNKLSNSLEIPPMSIGRWVNGTVGDPRLSMVVNLSSFFDVTIDDMVTKNLEVQDKSNRILAESVNVPLFEWDQPLTLETNSYVANIKIPKILSTGITKNIYSIVHPSEYYGIYPQKSVLLFSDDTNCLKPGDIILANNTLINSRLFIQYRDNNEYRNVLTYEKVDINVCKFEGILVNILLHNVFLKGHGFV